MARKNPLVQVPQGGRAPVDPAASSAGVSLEKSLYTGSRAHDHTASQDHVDHSARVQYEDQYVISHDASARQNDISSTSAVQGSQAFPHYRGVTARVVSAPSDLSHPASFSFQGADQSVSTAAAPAGHIGSPEPAQTQNLNDHTVYGDLQPVETPNPYVMYGCGLILCCIARCMIAAAPWPPPGLDLASFPMPPDHPVPLPINSAQSNIFNAPPVAPHWPTPDIQPEPQAPIHPPDLGGTNLYDPVPVATNIGQAYPDHPVAPPPFFTFEGGPAQVNAHQYLHDNTSPPDWPATEARFAKTNNPTSLFIDPIQQNTHNLSATSSYWPAPENRFQPPPPLHEPGPSGMNPNVPPPGVIKNGWLHPDPGARSSPAFTFKEPRAYFDRHGYSPRNNVPLPQPTTHDNWVHVNAVLNLSSNLNMNGNQAGPAPQASGSGSRVASTSGILAPKSSSLICRTCNKKFKRRNDLLDHVSMHDGVMRHKCKFCGQGIRYRNSLGNHERSCAAKMKKSIAHI